MTSDQSHHKKILNFSDFFSLSELKDLLFHVQERRFTIPQIQDSLSELGLKFCGFEADKNSHFKRTNTGADDPYDLGKWQAYEEANPNAFAGMYQFWCQKLIWRKTPHRHLYLQKDYSGSPTTSLYTPWTEAEVLAHLATGWGADAISELQLEYLYGPEPEVSG